MHAQSVPAAIVTALAAVVLVAAGCTPSPSPAGPADPSSNLTRDAGEPADPTSVYAMIDRQRGVVEQFFGESMPREFTTHVFEHRSEMSAFAQQQWSMPELPCWAVAMGTGSTLAVLSPTVWKTEACEHDPADLVATERIIAHELVHVFHGQRRPDDPEFGKADDAAWFVEGLAVYASGQLDAERERQAADVVASGHAPTRLADAWTGPARYSNAGTMVRLVDQRLGRDRLKSLLPASTSSELLAALRMNEDEFLAAWRASLAR